MSSRRSILPALAVAGLLAASAASAQSTDTLTATLSGAQVVGGGDQDGTGTAVLRLDADANRVCYELRVADITDATAAHIHRAPAGRNGPPVITLSAPTGGTAADCVDVDAALLAQLRSTPGAFYVNVHNPDFPGGAIRGQLAKSGGPPRR